MYCNYRCRCTDVVLFKRCASLILAVSCRRLTSVLAQALEYVLVDQQVKLIRELDGHVLKCARDAQSNHVIQRALERVPSDKLTFITDAVVGQVHNLATHPYGCRVLQRIFENCPTSQTRTLLDELHRSIQVLIQDQYGNVSEGARTLPSRTGRCRLELGRHR